MKHANQKNADDVLTTDSAAAFAKFSGAMGKLVSLPKSEPPKQRPKIVKRKRKPDA
jgi:hypothetical protein